MINFVPFMTGVFEESMQMGRERSAAIVAQREAGLETQKGISSLISSLVSGKMLTPENASLLENLNARGQATKEYVYGLSEAIEDEENDNITKLTTDLTLPFKLKFGDFKEAQNSMFEFSRYLGQNKNSLLDQIRSSDADMNALKQEIGNSYYLYNQMFYDKYSFADDGTKIKDSFPDYTTKIFENFDFFTKELGIVPKSQYKTAPTLVGQLDTQENRDSIYIPMNNVEGGVEGFFMPLDEFKERGVDVEDLTALSSYYGMDVRDIGVNVDILTYGEDKDVLDSVLLSDPAKLDAIAGGARLLAVNGKQLLLLNKGIDARTNRRSLQVLNEIGGGTAENGYADADIGAMRRAVFTMIKPSKYDSQIDMLASTSIDLSGTAYAESININVSDFREQDAANIEALEMQKALMAAQLNANSTGLTAGLSKFIAGFAGQLDQLGELFFNSSGTQLEVFQQNLTEDGTTVSSLYSVAEEFLGKQKLRDLNQIDIMRLTLAAKMARAVDPSGRLSDQDFRIQLERLGGTGIFTSTQGQIDKLQVVINEFERRDKEFSDTRSILSKDRINAEDRRFIRASAIVKNGVRASRNSARINIQRDTGATEATGDVGDAEPTQDFISTHTYTDQDGNKVRNVYTQSIDSTGGNLKVNMYLNGNLMSEEDEKRYDELYDAKQLDFNEKKEEQ